MRKVGVCMCWMAYWEKMHWRQSSSCPHEPSGLARDVEGGRQGRRQAAAARRPRAGTAGGLGGAHRRDAGLGEPWLRLHHIRDVMVPLLHDIASAGHGLDVQEDAGVADALDVDRGEEVVHVVAVDVARLRNGPNRRALRRSDLHGREVSGRCGREGRRSVELERTMPPAEQPERMMRSKVLRECAATMCSSCASRLYLPRSAQRLLA